VLFLTVYRVDDWGIRVLFLNFAYFQWCPRRFGEKRVQISFIPMGTIGDIGTKT
jgi:hypothetical protein